MFFWNLRNPFGTFLKNVSVRLSKLHFRCSREAYGDKFKFSWEKSDCFNNYKNYSHNSLFFSLKISIRLVELASASREVVLGFFGMFFKKFSSNLSKTTWIFDKYHPTFFVKIAFYEYRRVFLAIFWKVFRLRFSASDQFILRLSIKVFQLACQNFDLRLCWKYLRRHKLLKNYLIVCLFSKVERRNCPLVWESSIHLIQTKFWSLITINCFLNKQFQNVRKVFRTLLKII